MKTLLVLFLILACSVASAAPSVERVEVVTNHAATDDGGNAWGGHQTRIARTVHGLFTAYTVDGGGNLAREWRLAQRHDTGWTIIAAGPSGREPVNLLVQPDGTLLLVAWPEGQPRIWTATFEQGEFTGATDAPIPGTWDKSFWPYNAAAIDLKGNLFVLQSTVSMVPGQFNWAYAKEKHGALDWRLGKSEFDFRHCYAYIFPGKRGAVTIVASRDVPWDALGRKKPREQDFDFPFNALRVWTRRAGVSAPLTPAFTQEEPMTDAYPYATCYTRDAYTDARGLLHILYDRKGQTTEGNTAWRHAILKNGRLLKDVALPEAIAGFPRMFEDKSGQIYLLDAGSKLYTAITRDAAEWSAPIQLDFAGHEIEYSGAGLSIPRTGTPRADFIDGVFPSGKGMQWVYFRLRMK